MKSLSKLAAACAMAATAFVVNLDPVRVDEPAGDSSRTAGSPIELIEGSTKLDNPILSSTKLDNPILSPLEF